MHFEKRQDKGVVEVDEKKIGRPTDEPKTITKRARMSESDVEKLKKCCDMLNQSESNVIRLGIDKMYQELKEKATCPY